MFLSHTLISACSCSCATRCLSLLYYYGRNFFSLRAWWHHLQFRTLLSMSSYAQSMWCFFHHFQMTYRWYVWLMLFPILHRIGLTVILKKAVTLLQFSCCRNGPLVHDKQHLFWCGPQVQIPGFIHNHQFLLRWWTHHNAWDGCVNLLSSNKLSLIIQQDQNPNMSVFYLFHSKTVNVEFSA